MIKQFLIDKFICLASLFFARIEWKESSNGYIMLLHGEPVGSVYFVPNLRSFPEWFISINGYYTISVDPEYSIADKRMTETSSTFCIINTTHRKAMRIAESMLKEYV